MLKKICITFLLVFLAVNIFGSAEILEGYINDFSEAVDNSERVGILRKASSDNALNESAAAFFEYALQFAANEINDSEITDLSGLNSIIIISLNGLREAGSIENPEILLHLFLEYPVTEIKAEIMIAAGSLGKVNQLVQFVLLDYITELNSLFVSGQYVDYILISASITALMELDIYQSYELLLDILQSGYPEVIAFEASGALDLMSGNLYQFLCYIIENDDIVSGMKFAALKAGINSTRLNIAELGGLAELALKAALDASDNGGNENDLSALRFSAVSILTALRWTRANDLAIRHYYNMLAGYQENVSNKYRLIEAVNFLGAVGNSNAALTLGLQLGLINDRKEKTGYFDSDITLAVVQALGLIGYNGAFNHLLLASVLSYNENITSAAREAMDRLKW